jgi:hypothetical protein
MTSVRSVILLLLLALPGAAQEIGALTLIEGPLQVIRGTTVLQGAEGLRISQADIIQSSDSGFAQLELNDGTVIGLGPSSRLLFFSRSAGEAGREKSVALELLNGWLKSETRPQAGTYRCSSPLLATSAQGATVILHAGPERSEVYVESGSALVGEVEGEGSVRSPGSMKAGQFITRLAGKSLAVESRPSSEFVQAMPHSFRDTLPPRLAQFSGRRVAPKREHEVAYSEIQLWLTTRGVWRKGFVKRFEPRLHDAAFRKAVEAHLREHPEWDRILHPEKYQPETTPAQAQTSVP